MSATGRQGSDDHSTVLQNAWNVVQKAQQKAQRKAKSSNPTTWKEFAVADVFAHFQAERGRVIWREEAIFVFSPGERAGYVGMSEKRFAAEVTRFLATTAPYTTATGDGFSMMVKNLVAFAAAMVIDKPLPFFLDGREGAGDWMVFRNGRVNLKAAARRVAAGGELPTAFEPGVYEKNDDTLLTNDVIDADWNPAPCHMLMRWLEEVAPNEGTRTMLEILLALIVVGDAERKVFVTIQGDPNTAKSTFKKIAERVIGPEWVGVLPSWKALGDEKHRNQFAEKKVVFADDTAGTPKPAELEELKSLAGGGGLMRVKHLYNEPVNVPIRALFVLLTNNRNKIQLEDQALRNRERLIWLTEVFQGKRAVEGIEKAIADAERGQIIAAAVRWYAEVLKRGGVPQLGPGAELQKDYTAQEDALADFFKTGIRRDDAGKCIVRDDLIEEARRYLQAEGQDDKELYPDDDAIVAAFRKFYAVPAKRQQARVEVTENGVTVKKMKTVFRGFAWAWQDTQGPGKGRDAPTVSEAP